MAFRRVNSATSLALLASVIGCSSRIAVQVERFDLDGKARDGSSAREKYRQLAPAPGNAGLQRLILTCLRDGMEKYLAYVNLLNLAAMKTIPAPSTEGDKRLQDANGVMRELMQRLDSQLGRLDKEQTDSSASALTAETTFLINAVQTLPALLADRFPGLQLQENGIEEIVRQLEALKVDNKIFTDEILQPVKNTILAAGELRPSVNNLLSDLATLENSRTILSDLAKWVVTFRKMSAESFSLASAIANHSEGMLFPRIHKVYQDASDPFLSYISSHPELWRDSGNELLACGDGDAEYMLVFEQTVDARWKLVTVDPTKVVKARLKIARKVAEVLVSLAGIAAKAYGVPLPQGVLGKDPAGSASPSHMDFSAMTAEAENNEANADEFRADLTRLKNIAQGLKSGLTAENAASVLQEIKRLTERYTKE